MCIYFTCYLNDVNQDLTSDTDERVKATLMLCYGYVALYAPPSLIVSRMEATVLRTINPNFHSIKVIRLKHVLGILIQLHTKQCTQLRVKKFHFVILSVSCTFLNCAYTSTLYMCICFIDTCTFFKWLYTCTCVHEIFDRKLKSNKTWSVLWNW